MVDLPLYDKDGKSTGTVAVDEQLFGEKVLKKLLHQVVVIYEGNLRQGNASTRTRAEVRYSSKKPWPQKNTGNARSGSRRSPIWRHGGVAFGPKPRDYRKKMTAKMRRAALDSALLGKIQDSEVSIIEGFEFSEPKAVRMAKILKETGIEGKMLIASDSDDKNTYLSARNLDGVSYQRVGDLNAYEVLKHKRLLLTKGALDKLVEARKARSKTS